ncbi:SMI1/KNR4 family protein [Jiella mangrovi]|uniref:SMI1/KNR4 family protein n=1 Tax=Jiella mangrovi TaxID=2821407 RepID=A0ABS4BM12_9HYPH|nr:SMI1/KNR4 family protein [Jiella mangrovi]MBP0617768.1 SMI1/KNR4 family protein [Jiella mangrovi]
MDLKSINPYVYAMWDEYRTLGPDYYQETSPKTLAEIEAEAGAKLPEDYKEFALEYSCFDAIPRAGTDLFYCAFPNQAMIMYTSCLTPHGASILQSMRSLRRPHPVEPDVTLRLPDGVVPFNAGRGHSTIMLDLRPATHGQVLFLDEIKVQNFGTPGYDWDNVGWVAKTYTDFLRGLGTEEELVARYHVPVKS